VHKPAIFRFNHLIHIGALYTIINFKIIREKAMVS